MNKLSWSFANIWNESLACREERKLEPRERIWASELGGPMLDRWYKMKGVKPSNPFGFRPLRKFEAGNLFEWITAVVLNRAGILIEQQRWLRYQYDGLLPVTGRLDHLAGGKPDWGKAEAAFTNGEFPEFISRAAAAIVKHFRTKHPNGLRRVVLEIKSVGSNLFHRYDVFRMADPRHRLQLFHYLKAGNFKEGHLVYVSKDDLCLVEIGVFANPALEEAYRKDIEQITGCLKSKTPPEKEKPIAFDDVAGRFYVNWKVSCSQYLTKAYGFPSRANFEARYKSRVARWNRVLGRLASGKKMTDDNKEAMEEMRAEFPDLDELLEIVKKRQKVKEAYDAKNT